MKRQRYSPAIPMNIVLVTAFLARESEPVAKKRTDKLSGACIPQAVIRHAAHVATVTNGSGDIRLRLMSDDLFTFRSSSTTMRATSCNFRMVSSLV